MQRRHKEDLKTMKCAFIGYSDWGYILWNPSTSHITNYSSVKFNELKMWHEPALDDLSSISSSTWTPNILQLTPSDEDEEGISNFHRDASSSSESSSSDDDTEFSPTISTSAKRNVKGKNVVFNIPNSPISVTSTDTVKATPNTVHSSSSYRPTPSSTPRSDHLTSLINSLEKGINDVKDLMGQSPKPPRSLAKELLQADPDTPLVRKSSRPKARPVQFWEHEKPDYSSGSKINYQEDNNEPSFALHTEAPDYETILFHNTAAEAYQRELKVTHSLYHKGLTQAIQQCFSATDQEAHLIPLLDKMMMNIVETDNTTTYGNDDPNKPYVPMTFEEAIADPLRGKDWCNACLEEIKSIQNREVYKLVPLPEGRKAIKSKWVLAIKFDDKGNIERRKARLVAKGFQQKEGIDYHEIYSPVTKHVTIRVMFAFAVNKGYDIIQLDVKTAFLYSLLNE